MSIMHYGRDYFAKLDTEKRHYLTTIKTKDPKYQNLIGQRKYLTPSDILMVNTMYGCPGKYTFLGIKCNSKDWQIVKLILEI